MDEVGGNIHMTGDGDIGGEQYLCEKGTIPQMKTSKGDKHFTLLGLTLLSGDALMCVVIFSGKRRNTMVETGIDMFAEEFGEFSDKDYILKIVVKTKGFREDRHAHTAVSISHVYANGLKTDQLHLIFCAKS